MSGCGHGSQVNLVACFKHMLCNSRGSDIALLEGRMMFLQVQVQ